MHSNVFSSGESTMQPISSASLFVNLEIILCDFPCTLTNFPGSCAESCGYHLYSLENEKQKSEIQPGELNFEFH